MVDIINPDRVAILFLDVMGSIRQEGIVDILPTKGNAVLFSGDGHHTLQYTTKRQENGTKLRTSQTTW